MSRRKLLCVCLLGALSLPVSAQVVDSLSRPTPTAMDTIVVPPTAQKENALPSPSKKKTIKEINTTKADNKPKEKKAKPFSPSSKKALLFSIIPGGGQIYNRAYWKIPIIAGAYTACYYAVTWNHANLMEYANAFRDVKGDHPLENTSWIAFTPYGSTPEEFINDTSFHNRLKRGRDFYRRNRDLSIVVSVGVYLLVMIDAYVDAELYNFDLSPNLSLSYAPTISLPSASQPSTGYGVSLALRF